LEGVARQANREVLGKRRFADAKQGVSFSNCAITTRYANKDRRQRLPPATKFGTITLRSA
jgi:hypothetical protein